MTLPAPGTSITLVHDIPTLRDGKRHTRWTIVTGSVLNVDTSNTGEDINVFVGGETVRLFLDEEGVDWIHGAHAPESEEAQALLASFTLMYLLG